ncbi:MAG: universal stress protein [Chloroflexota bacterium]
MQPVHVTVVGAIIAVTFLVSISAIILWMLRLPEQTPTTLRVARAVRLTQHANQILVPVLGGPRADRSVALAAQMARARRAPIEVFYPIEVPWTLPLNARLPRAETHAREVLERAHRIAQRFGVHLVTRVANVRDVGRAIVHEAVATGADVILLGDIPEQAGEARLNPTVSYVYNHAPSEVIIDRPALAGR